MSNDELRFQKIKNFKGILNREPATKGEKYIIGFCGLFFGMLLFLTSCFVVFDILEFLSYPRLFLYFPGAHAVVFAFAVIGFLIIVRSIKMLAQKIKAPPNV